MDAKEQGENEPAEAKKELDIFLEERHHSIISPPSSANFQAAQHYTFSALWSKALSKRLHVVSN